MSAISLSRVVVVVRCRSSWGVHPGVGLVLMTGKRLGGCMATPAKHGAKTGLGSWRFRVHLHQMSLGYVKRLNAIATMFTRDETCLLVVQL
jgi:hypothetical protein